MIIIACASRAQRALEPTSFARPAGVSRQLTALQTSLQGITAEVEALRWGQEALQRELQEARERIDLLFQLGRTARGIALDTHKHQENLQLEMRRGQEMAVWVGRNLPHRLHNSAAVDDGFELRPMYIERPVSFFQAAAVVQGAFPSPAVGFPRTLGDALNLGLPALDRLAEFYEDFGREGLLPLPGRRALFHAFAGIPQRAPAPEPDAPAAMEEVVAEHRPPAPAPRLLNIILRNQKGQDV